MSKKHFYANDIKKLERFYRVNLINSATGYKAANLIGTYSEKGIANLALFSSVIHLGSNPALIGLIQRPPGPLSHTYKNIKKNYYYSINHIHENFIENAHYTSAKFDNNTSEFDLCKLGTELIEGFNAPFVKESSVQIGMKFIKEIPIELNGTILIIGKVEHLVIKKDSILEDGNIDLNRLASVCTSGQSTYHKALKLKSLPYAKADMIPKLKPI